MIVRVRLCVFIPIGTKDTQAHVGSKDGTLDKHYDLFGSFICVSLFPYSVLALGSVQEFYVRTLFSTLEIRFY